MAVALRWVVRVALDEPAVFLPGITWLALLVVLLLMQWW